MLIKNFKDVQKYLNSLEYVSKKNNFFLNTAARSILEQKVNCFEGAMVAALIMENFGYPPLVLEMITKKSIPYFGRAVPIGHVIWHAPASEGFFSLGVSSIPSLKNKFDYFNNLEELVFEYKKGLDKAGYGLQGWMSWNLNQLKIDWRYGEPISRKDASPIRQYNFVYDANLSFNQLYLK